jgi:hypothetical protein
MVVVPETKYIPATNVKVGRRSSFDSRFVSAAIYRLRRTELTDRIGSGKRSLPFRARRRAVVLPAVAEVLRADSVLEVHGEAAYRADQARSAPTAAPPWSKSTRWLGHRHSMFCETSGQSCGAPSGRICAAFA